MDEGRGVFHSYPAVYIYDWKYLLNLAFISIKVKLFWNWPLNCIIWRYLDFINIKIYMIIITIIKIIANITNLLAIITNIILLLTILKEKKLILQPRS